MRTSGAGGSCSDSMDAESGPSLRASDRLHAHCLLLCSALVCMSPAQPSAPQSPSQLSSCIRASSPHDASRDPPARHCIARHTRVRRARLPRGGPSRRRQRLLPLDLRAAVAVRRPPRHPRAPASVQRRAHLGGGQRCAALLGSDPRGREREASGHGGCRREGRDEARGHRGVSRPPAGCRGGTVRRGQAGLAGTEGSDARHSARATEIAAPALALALALRSRPSSPD